MGPHERINALVKGEWKTCLVSPSRLPWWLRQWSVCLQCRRPRFNPWVRKMPWRRKWLCSPVFLPGGSHEQRSLVGYSSWGHKEPDLTEGLTLVQKLRVLRPQDPSVQQDTERAQSWVPTRAWTMFTTEDQAFKFTELTMRSSGPGDLKASVCFSTP